MKVLERLRQSEAAERAFERAYRASALETIGWLLMLSSHGRCRSTSQDDDKSVDKSLQDLQYAIFAAKKRIEDRQQAADAMAAELLADESRAKTAWKSALVEACFDA